MMYGCWRPAGQPAAMAGEARYRLRPLAVPAPSAPEDVVGGAAAVALFADRARQLDPAFALTGESGPLVARIVARLDGMPLAIELAAARVEALGLGQLLERLDHRFALLTGGDRTAAARQWSLAATADWSYQLLSERDRRVFRRLAMFPAPFTLDAAEAVAGAAAESAVLHLVDCSLLVPPQPGPDGRPRYAMLETLRAFGLDRLAEAGEQPEAAASLAGYALAAAEQAAARLGIQRRRAVRCPLAGRRRRRRPPGPDLGTGTQHTHRAAPGRCTGTLVAAARPFRCRARDAAARHRAVQPA